MCPKTLYNSQGLQGKRGKNVKLLMVVLITRLQNVIVIVLFLRARLPTIF